MESTEKGVFRVQQIIMKNIYKKMTRLSDIYEYVRKKVMSGAAARTGKEDEEKNEKQEKI